MTSQIELLARETDAEMARLTGIIFDGINEIKRLREALEAIVNLSDLEMADGDGAREIASRVLSAGQSAPST